MELSKRLMSVASMVTPGSKVADIGCDHGFVSIYLVEKEICPRVIAMDVNEGPLLRAKEHVSEHGLDKRIDIRLSDGIDKLLEKEADSIFIAGMGGRLVIKILSDHFDKVKDLKEIILQPQSELHLVRNFLAKQGLTIVQEDMVEEAGKFYPCMKAVWKEETVDYTELEEWYGPLLLRQEHSVLHRFLLKEKSMFEQITEDIRSNAKCGVTEEAKAENIKKRIGQINKALSYFEKQEG